MSTTFHPVHSNEFRRPASNAWLTDGISLVRDVLVTMFAKPEPRALTRKEEAEELREMASSLMVTDPSFAEDLFAAASRHESQ